MAGAAGSDCVAVCRLWKAKFGRLKPRNIPWTWMDHSSAAERLAMTTGYCLHSTGRCGLMDLLRVPGLLWCCCGLRDLLQVPGLRACAQSHRKPCSTEPRWCQLALALERSRCLSAHFQKKHLAQYLPMDLLRMLTAQKMLQLDQDWTNHLHVGGKTQPNAQCCCIQNIASESRRGLSGCPGALSPSLMSGDHGMWETGHTILGRSFLLTWR